MGHKSEKVISVRCTCHNILIIILAGSRTDAYEMVKQQQPALCEGKINFLFIRHPGLGPMMDRMFFVFGNRGKKQRKQSLFGVVTDSCITSEHTHDAHVYEFGSEDLKDL